MSSLRRLRASRANGALSRGPKTPDGKLRSSQNSVRHGLTAACVLLGNESRDGFNALFQQFLDRFGPVDDVEFGMIEELASSYWRMRRAWAIETSLLQQAMDAQPAESAEVSRLSSAFTSLASQPQLALLHRYETRLQMAYQRAFHNILLLRSVDADPDIPNEPNPDFEQSHLLPPLTESK